MTQPINKQALHGILLLNKPTGITSNGALQKAKRLFQAQKAGHTGSLDPLATGMLPICFGEATKLSHYLLNSDKCYEVSALLGVKTNTGDAMGEVIARAAHVSVSKADLQSKLSQFVGHSRQYPPMFSALKYQGKPLYKLAREGIEVERQARDIWIHELQLLQFAACEFTLKVVCSKGTYIRTLVEDIGERLGSGAHVTRLHRSYVAGFNDESMHTLQELQELPASKLQDFIMPMERAVDYLPALSLSEEEVQRLYYGQTISGYDHAKSDTAIRLYNSHQSFIGLGEIQEDGMLAVKRLFSLAK